ncbi:uncharacterized protein BJ212DRAFT_1589722 [Suillus subaureus]|uniref:Uncharacterized protein n=1 Tax=Suillus subaureus TaxID=48587 RepID=A0A9P7E2C7_9AGAM|nr:uncharacterized protein BJ212DRAFT_1589722 [Suillus subaureus]KAG1809608.1 hypothetical protein BJ212DRAFT_1589722 [Suillus subaureus]
MYDDVITDVIDIHRLIETFKNPCATIEAPTIAIYTPSVIFIIPLFGTDVSGSAGLMSSCGFCIWNGVLGSRSSISFEGSREEYGNQSYRVVLDGKVRVRPSWYHRTTGDNNGFFNNLSSNPKREFEYAITDSPVIITQDSEVSSRNVWFVTTQQLSLKLEVSASIATRSGRPFQTRTRNQAAGMNVFCSFQLKLLRIREMIDRYKRSSQERSRECEASGASRLATHNQHSAIFCEAPLRQQPIRSRLFICAERKRKTRPFINILSPISMPHECIVTFCLTQDHGVNPSKGLFQLFVPHAVIIFYTIPPVGVQACATATLGGRGIYMDYYSDLSLRNRYFGFADKPIIDWLPQRHWITCSFSKRTSVVQA